jgi:O-antigen ligase
LAILSLPRRSRLVESRERLVSLGLLALLPLLGAATAVLSSQLLVPVVAAAGLAWLVCWCLPALRLGSLALRCEWWQILWLFTLASGFVFRSRTISDASTDPLDSAALLRVGVMGLVTLALQFAIIGKRIDVLSPMFRGLFLLMTLFNATNLISYVWSVNPPWTLYRAFEHTMDVTLAIAIAALLKDAAGYRRLFSWTWLLMAATLGSVTIGVLLAPDRALDRGIGVLGFSIEGVYPLISRNSVGALGALVAVVSMARLATGAGSKRLYWGVLLIGVTVVIVSQTRSAIAPLALATPIVLLASRRVGFALALPVLMVAALLMTNLGGTFDRYWQRNETSGQIHLLNGRLTFWEYSWDLAEERPLTGYGAYAGGRFEVASAVGHDTLSSTHGTYTEVLVGTGFPGLVLVLLMVLGCWFYIGRAAVVGKRDTEEDRATWALSVEALGVLTLLTGHSIFDVDLIWHPSIAFLALFAYAEYLRRNGLHTPRARAAAAVTRI